MHGLVSQLERNFHLGRSKLGVYPTHDLGDLLGGYPTHDLGELLGIYPTHDLGEILDLQLMQERRYLWL